MNLNNNKSKILLVRPYCFVYDSQGCCREGKFFFFMQKIFSDPFGLIKRLFSQQHLHSSQQQQQLVLRRRTNTLQVKRHLKFCACSWKDAHCECASSVSAENLQASCASTRAHKSRCCEFLNKIFERHRRVRG